MGRSRFVLRQRYLVGIKLMETFFRGLFVLVCTYWLSLEEAGRFGLFATIIGLLSFGLGYERHIDIQRQVAGRSLTAIRRRMFDTLRFFRLHYMLVLPIAMLAAVVGGVTPWSVAQVFLVIVGEHLANQAYLAVLLDRRAYPLLLGALVKNALQLVAVVYVCIGEPETLTTIFILQLWSFASIGYAMVAAICWRLYMLEPMSEQGDELPAQTVREQYRASAPHFLMGLVAVAALQVDRLMVGSMLSGVDVGLYFRNVALAGLALQIFNIASFSRVAPGVFQSARDQMWQPAAKVVKVEFLRFAVALTGLVILALLIDQLLGNPASRLGLQVSFVLIMTSGVLLRAAADYKGLLLLSLGGDGALFRNQAAAVLLGAVGLFFLTWAYRLPGAFLGATLTPLLYFLLNRWSVQRRYGQFKISLP